MKYLKSLQSPNNWTGKIIESKGKIKKPAKWDKHKNKTHRRRYFECGVKAVVVKRRAMFAKYAGMLQ
jgi:hypothetical protein